MDMDRRIVIDNGSELIKAGWAGDDSPRSVFPSVCGWSKNSGRGYYVGDEVNGMNDLKRKWPLQHGEVRDYTSMEMLWHHAFQQCDADPEGISVLFTESPFTATEEREKMCQVMFETYGVGALYLATPAALALYASGRYSGIVVGSGGSLTYSLPVYEGHIIHHAKNNWNFGGRDLTELMSKLVQQESQIYKPNPERYKELEIMKEIKHNHARLLMFYEEEKAKQQEPSFYKLPDNKNLTVRQARFTCPETLFQPSLIGSDNPGIHRMCFDSIMKSDQTLHKKLFDNIVLEGGNTMFAGIADRFQREIRALAPPYLDVKIIVPPERRSSVWIGGSILGSLHTFQEMWLSKERYDEVGPTGVSWCMQ